LEFLDDVLSSPLKKNANLGVLVSTGALKKTKNKGCFFNQYLIGLENNYNTPTVDYSVKNIQ